MASALAAPQKLLTAEEFRLLPGDGQRRELVRGVAVVLNFPGFRHGEVSGIIHHYFDTFVRQHQLGRTLTNDSGIITEHDPDTVRGADVSFYSFQRVPKGVSPVGYASASPEIVFEVVSPWNSRAAIRRKTAEYLDANVKVVCVVDSEFKTVNLHYPD